MSHTNLFTQVVVYQSHYELLFSDTFGGVFLHCLHVQAQELSEANVKIGLLEKKVESADAECAKMVQAERDEVERFKNAFDLQEM